MSKPDTSYTIAKDGTRIAFDSTGSGPALVLLHGFNKSRCQTWHETGYVERLKNDFTIITIDARGHGESDAPTSIDAYGIEAMCQDVLSVVDACKVGEFAIWGYSYGGNIGRFLSVASNRVTAFVMVGIPFGPAASAEFRSLIADYREKWTAILGVQRDGTLDIDTLSEGQRSHLENVNVAARMAALGAILSWGSIEPYDLSCPTLWLVGSENERAMQSVEDYKSTLDKTVVDVAVVQGLDHRGEITEIDQVFPLMLKFTQSKAT